MRFVILPISVEHAWGMLGRILDFGRGGQGPGHRVHNLKRLMRYTSSHHLSEPLFLSSLRETLARPHADLHLVRLGQIPGLFVDGMIWTQDVEFHYCNPRMWWSELSCTGRRRCLIRLLY